MRWIYPGFLIVFLPLNLKGGPSDSLRRFEFSHPQMGTLFRILCYSESEEKAIDAAQKAFQVIDTLNTIFSDYVPFSELNHLSNYAGMDTMISVSPPLFEILNTSLKWNKASSGVFDISIGSLTRLWRRAGRLEELPDEMSFASAIQSAGCDFITLDSISRSVKLNKTGMMLDLGGIAKGYAVDTAYKIVSSAGLPICLVDGGGDIYAGLAPPGTDGWKVKIEDIKNGEELILIKNQSIATSGDLYRFVSIGDQKYSHIIDPRTGFGITIPRTVTVLAPEAETADVLATILSILGPEEGFRFLKSFPEAKARIIQEENGVIRKYEYGKITMEE